MKNAAFLCNFICGVLVTQVVQLFLGQEPTVNTQQGEAHTILRGVASVDANAPQTFIQTLSAFLNCLKDAYILLSPVPLSHPVLVESTRG